MASFNRNSVLGSIHLILVFNRVAYGTVHVTYLAETRAVSLTLNKIALLTLCPKCHKKERSLQCLFPADLKVIDEDAENIFKSQFSFHDIM